MKDKIKKLIAYLKMTWHYSGWGEGYDLMMFGKSPIRRIRARAARVTQFARACLGGLGCLVVGHKMVVEEGGDAENGPNFSWHCGRCGGCCGHRGY